MLGPSQAALRHEGQGVAVAATCGVGPQVTLCGRMSHVPRHLSSLLESPATCKIGMADFY